VSTSEPAEADPPPRGRRAPVRSLLLIALALVAALVLHAVLVRVLFLPDRLALEIEIETREHGLLRATPHIGRGYFPGDARDQPLRPGRRVYRAELPFDARAVKIQLLVAPAAIQEIGRASVAGRVFERGSRTRKDESRSVVVLDKLPALMAVPAWGHALCLLLAGAAVLGLARVRATAAIARATRPAELLSVRGALAAVALVAVVVVALATCADVYGILVRGIDNPPFWPVSIFDPVVPGGEALLGAGLLFVGFALAARHILRGGRSALPVLLAVAAASALASNALGGVERGLAVPLSEPSSYLRDAIEVRDPASFLASYTDHQLQLRTHSRTHPPGAVLVHHALHRMLGDPIWIAAVLGVAVAIALAWLVYGLARRFLERQQALFAALLAASLPAVQIYAVSSLDALVCVLFTAVIYCALHPDPRIRYGGGVLSLSAALFLSFGALFLVPVLVGYELLARRSLRTAAIVVAGTAAVLALLYLASGFDWVESFRIASRRENPAGFRLLVNPGDYLFTRLECAVEILLFAGPFVVALWLRGLGVAREAARPLWLLAVVASLTLLAMFLTGSFKTGETARACLFICPYLVLPVAALAGDEGALDRDRQLDVVCLVMAQTLVMQVAGDYFW